MTDDTGFGFNTTSDKIKEVNPLHMCKVNLTSMEAKTQPTESQLNIYIYFFCSWQNQSRSEPRLTLQGNITYEEGNNLMARWEWTAHLSPDSSKPDDII